MKTILNDHLKGNYGEAYVAALLSAHCLVRPVAQGTDIGVDLYCESVKHDTPFLHFWVQVKTGGKCKLSKDGSGNTATYSFKKQDLRYWEKQPVPVFAALVPMEWPPQEEPIVYVVNLTRKFLERNPNGRSPKKGGRETKTVTLRSDLCWRPREPDDIRRFFEKELPEAHAHILLKHGIVAPGPTLQPQYVQKFTSFPVSSFRKEILQQLRRTAALSIIFLQEMDAENEEFRKKLAKVLEAFEGDCHWENCAARGFNHHLDEEFRKAVCFYDKAIAIIRRDSRFQEGTTWQRIEQQLTGLQDLAEKRKRPPHGFLSASDG
ncbi:MAG TPA: DUF4365 domain-containing protein [Thermoguttaceae bacterium]|nr:DUF4365 domain-containing protein [Thermoguttaceae bacterium]